MTNEKKVLKNSEHIIKIVSVTAKGFGVGYIDDFIIFVDSALTGDELRIHILKVKTRYGYGKILEIITPSPYRIKSQCPVSTNCGGCQWQNCTYEAQLEFKKQIVIDQLERIGGVKNPPVKDILASESLFRYRNKAVFPVVKTESSFAIGMYAMRTHRIIHVNDCNIQHDAHIKVLAVFKEFMTYHKIKPYDEKKLKGLVRHITIRNSLATNEVMVVITINGKSIPREKDLIKRLKAINVNTTILSFNETHDNNVLGYEFKTLYGNGYITEKLGDISYNLSAPSFFQVNPKQAKVLYSTAVEMAELNGSQTVIDAHCGVGGVALFTAGSAKEVIGVDIVPSAINDAIKNAELGGITNAKFIVGAAEERVPELLKEIEGEVIIFLDPPRKGCEPELLTTLIESPVKKIVYISCDPATLARDIKVLTSGGFETKNVVPVDMFPMTGKVETCVLLKRT